MNGITRTLVEVFEDRLAHGTGDLSPALDDIAIDYRKRTGRTLRFAVAIVERRLDVVLALLEADGWFGTKVTSYYTATYKGTHPDTDADIARCVAGVAGPAWATHAIHFCTTDNCVLWMQRRIHSLDSGEKKVRRNVERMDGAVQSGLLTADGLTTIAVNSGTNGRRDIGRVHRLAVKREVARLK